MRNDDDGPARVFVVTIGGQITGRLTFCFGLLRRGEDAPEGTPWVRVVGRFCALVRRA